jgi:hypothetical protein
MRRALELSLEGDLLRLRGLRWRRRINRRRRGRRRHFVSRRWCYALMSATGLVHEPANDDSGYHDDAGYPRCRVALGRDAKRFVSSHIISVK